MVKRFLAKRWEVTSLRVHPKKTIDVKQIEVIAALLSAFSCIMKKVKLASGFPGERQMRGLCTAVISFSLVMSGTAWAELQKQDRDELFQRIDHMCRDASSVGEVVTYEGSLDAGATLKVVGLGATGKVTKEQWKNIEQKYGEYRGTPTICNIEIFKLILPLFSEKVPSPKTCTNQAFGLASWENEETLNGTSGWRGGGYNQGAYCTDFINGVIQSRGLGSQPHFVDEVHPSEENKRTGFMNSHAEYNYHCSIKLHWNPNYKSRTDPICGLQ